jgi:hypothetical protein
MITGIALFILLLWCVFGGAAGYMFWEDDEWPINQSEPKWLYRSIVMALLYGPLFFGIILLGIIFCYGGIKWEFDLHNKMSSGECRKNITA